MKFLPLIVANLRRKKIRTILTIGSFAAAFFLFGLLAAIHYGFRQGIDIAGADRLMVINKISFIEPLPVTYRERLRRVPGVRNVGSFTWFGGIYQDPKNVFESFAIDPDDYRALYPEFVVDPAEWQAFLQDRQGAIVGAALAKRFNWKVGDHVPLRAQTYFGGEGWDFNVRGLYHGTRSNDDETQFWLRRDYVYEKRLPTGSRSWAWYVIRVADEHQASAVAKRIDEEFANSAAETRTESESAMAEGFVKQLGNIEFLIRAIGSIVFFTLLLVTGNTMAIAVRERTNEIATMKALGFTARSVLGMVLAESIFVAMIGGVTGLLLCRQLVTLDLTQGQIMLYIPLAALAAGGVMAIVTGAVAGLIPALNAMRLNVAAALRRL